MKKLITLTFALFLTAGIAFGQNTATTDQVGSDNTAEVLQEGSGNSADIDQGVDNILGIKEANDNFARIEQTGTDGTARILQIGDNNRANDLRSENPNVPGISDAGHGNDVFIEQRGDNNVARARLSSETSDNDVNLEQGQLFGGTSSENVAQAFVQEGAGNSIQVNQQASGDHFAIVGAGVMRGDGNQVFVTQSGTNQDVNRVDDRSFRGINIDGDLNRIDVFQTGNAHKAAAKVVGDMNDVDITQNGSLNTASSLVLGSGNMATITQQ